MPAPLNILSLHRMGPPWRRREAVRELEEMMSTYATGHHCLVHDADLPLPDYIKQVPFHAIVLGPTFLCARYAPALFRQTRETYDWIKHTSAVKIAMPQDDYDCAAILDRWMVDWGVDRVVTVCPGNWDVLYPAYSRTGEIKLGYTGYISEQWTQDWAAPKRHEDRPIDVSYRAAKLPANFGSVGALKSEIAGRFVRAAAGKSLRLDISTDSKDLIPGRAWHAFLENSKFCLVTPSGSSLLDPEGEFRRRVTRYTDLHPRAEFAEIAAQCFPGEDRKYSFTPISPRNLEAALAGTVQIATPGAYSGLMQPLRHYIPLNEDCSNIDSVLAIIRDKERVERIAADCKNLVLHTTELRFANHVQNLVHFIAAKSAEKKLPPAGESTGELFIRYAAQMQRIARRHWAVQRMRDWARTTAIRFGARRMKRLLTVASRPS
jgi:hypothetical protein